MELFDALPERHILVAVDETESADRAVMYVAGMLGGLRGFRVTLFHVVAEPHEEFFANDEDRKKWVNEHRENGAMTLERLSDILVQSGFEQDKVNSTLEISRCDSIADRIIEETDKVGACTVVLSRRRITKKEEFLFGSTTNRLLHSTKNCALWIVE